MLVEVATVCVPPGLLSASLYSVLYGLVSQGLPLNKRARQHLEEHSGEYPEDILQVRDEGTAQGKMRNLFGNTLYAYISHSLLWQFPGPYLCHSLLVPCDPHLHPPPKKKHHRQAMSGVKSTTATEGGKAVVAKVINYLKFICRITGTIFGVGGPFHRHWLLIFSYTCCIKTGGQVKVLALTKPHVLIFVFFLSRQFYQRQGDRPKW